MDNNDSIKYMILSLQRQRNSSMDKVVDLEVLIESRNSQIAVLQEDLVNANDTINSMRDLYAKKVAECEALKAELASPAVADTDSETIPEPTSGGFEDAAIIVASEQGTVVNNINATVKLSDRNLGFAAQEPNANFKEFPTPAQPYEPNADFKEPPAPSQPFEKKKKNFFK